MKINFTFLITCLFLIINKYQFAQQPGMNLYKHFCGNDAVAGDNQGHSTCTFNNKVITGVPHHSKDISNNNVSWVGCAYIYEETTPGNWIETKLSPPDGNATDIFGYSVAINDSFAVVGAPQNDYHFSNSSSAITGIGAAYVYKRTSLGNWTFLNKLSGWAGYLSQYDAFGSSVSIYDKTIVVGAPNFQHDTINGPTVNAGAAFIFEYKTNPFSHFSNQIPVHILTSQFRQANDDYGRSVSIHKNTIVIGASSYNYTAAITPTGYTGQAGAVFIYQKNTNSIWQYNNFFITPSAYRESYSRLGTAVSVYDSIIVAGVPLQNASPTATVGGQGMAIALKKNPLGNWQLDDLLLPGNPIAGSGFGNSVSVYGQQVAVGATGGVLMNTTGLCYLFKKIPNTGWQQQNWSNGYQHPNAQNYDYLGTNVSLYKNRFVAGAYNYDLDVALNTKTEIGATFMWCGSASFSTQPINKIICEGANTQFDVKTYFTENYQWQVSTDNGTTWSNVSNSGIYSGANTASLQLTNVPFSYNNNWYQCLISNECSTAPYASNVGVLNVDQGPNITFTMSTNFFCTSASSYTLNAYSIWGGLYNGAGISGNVFSPSIAGVGTHTIGFTSTNGSNGCSENALQTVTVSVCTNMNEESLTGDFIIYPNPSSERLYIESTNDKIQFLNIYNTLGMLVLKQEINENKTIMNIDKLVEGCYFIELNTQNKTIKQKFLIKH